MQPSEVYITYYEYFHRNRLIAFLILSTSQNRATVTKPIEQEFFFYSPLYTFLLEFGFYDNVQSFVAVKASCI